MRPAIALADPALAATALLLGRSRRRGLAAGRSTSTQVGAGGEEDSSAGRRAGLGCDGGFSSSK